MKSTLRVDGQSIQHIRPDGTNNAVTWNDLRSVSIETNSCGPFIEDVYCLLEGAEYSFYIPQSTDGFDSLVEQIFKLPGFDTRQFIAAMSCTNDAVFRCWERSHEQ
jgi:hypothetical protein